MMKRHTPPSAWLKPSALLLAMTVAGCSSLTPQPLEDQAIRTRAADDRVQMFNMQEPISEPISLNQAIARALKYNLDLRLKKMEIAVNDELREASKLDMLPNLILGAGYSGRDNYSGGNSRPLTGPPGSQPDTAGAATAAFSTSSDLSRRLRSVEFSWNVLDFGVSYYRAKQRADEFLIAQERKRRVIQTTVHDVRYAFWRALAAQRLAAEAESVMTEAQQAIDQSKAAEERGVLPVQVTLAYQRSLVDAIALLNTRRQELDFAKAELGALMSAPANAFTLQEEAETPLPPLPTNLSVLEDTALLNRPELREEDLRRRISADETRRQLMQAFPNLTLGLGSQSDSNSLLYNSQWIENSARLSWSLFRFLTAPQVKKAGDKQLETDDARRQALSMAIITQMRIAALRYGLAQSDLQLAQKSLDVDLRAADVARSGVTSMTETELERVRASARATVAKYQRAIAYANAQAAYARIQHSLGQDLSLGPMDDMGVNELGTRVGQALADAEQRLPTPLITKAGPRPKVHLRIAGDAMGQAVRQGATRALKTGGFDLVECCQPGIISVSLTIRMGESEGGLLRSEVELTESSSAKAIYRAVLPANPHISAIEAVSEAAVIANIGNLREWVAAKNP